jgi:cation diffusion facilitator family transporter
MAADPFQDHAHRQEDHAHRQEEDAHADDDPHRRGDTHGHCHDDGREQEHSHDDRRQGLIARLKRLVVPHSHDTADQVDSALEASREGMRCLAWSFTALMVTASLQVAVVLISGSVALLGDTLHNFADALTAVPLAIAFTVGRRAATRRYTYGYGRAEDLAGLVVVLLIALSAALAGWEAVRRLLDPQEVTALPLVAVAGLVGFIGNELVAQYRIRVGRRIGSAALVADGLHARTDGFTSLAVLLGASGVALGIPAADPIVGLLITGAILLVLRDATREVYRRLMDAVEPELVSRAEASFADTPGVDQVGELRMRWIGHSLRAEVEVVVPSDLPLAEAHQIAHEAEHRLLHDLPRLSAALVHAHPGSAASRDAHRLVEHHRQ